jgi:hypothetical protein
MVIQCFISLTQATYAEMSSLEPGYYEDNEFGIRIESLLLVKESIPKVIDLLRNCLMIYLQPPIAGYACETSKNSHLHYD